MRGAKRIMVIREIFFPVWSPKCALLCIRIFLCEEVVGQIFLLAILLEEKMVIFSVKQRHTRVNHSLSVEAN
jgi:hypothetical protein